jgi:PKD repeat protein
LSFLCFLLFFVFIIISVNGVNAESTTVSVSPADVVVTTGESGSLTLSCTPSEPVKAFECSLQFDPTLLEITSITEGTFFDGYNTFNNSGTIDNANGEVTHIYGLIMGNGNVSSEGSLISISYSAKQIGGLSFVNISDLGITNETQYLSSSLSNASVTIQDNISISNEQPTDASSSVSINTSYVQVDISNQYGRVFNVNISSNPDVGSLYSANQSNGTVQCLISNLSYDTLYSWTVSVEENATGFWKNETFSFTTESDPSSEQDDEDEDEDETEDEQDNSPPASGPSPGGFPSPGPMMPPPIEENSAPSTPLLLQASSKNKLGTMYTCTIRSNDSDDDQLRYLVNWDDGSEQTWTSLYDANTTVTLTHQWNTSMNYTVHIKTQDSTGLNSTDVLTFTVSCYQPQQTENKENTSVDFSVDETHQHNGTISLHALMDNMTTGSIQSVLWDFGDGTTGEGASFAHTYQKPGRYNVTLTVMDSSGRTYQKTMEVDVPASSSLQTDDGSHVEENRLFGLLITGGILFIGLICVFKFKDSIVSYLYQFKQGIISYHHDHHLMMDVGKRVLSPLHISEGIPHSSLDPRSVPSFQAESTSELNVQHSDFFNPGHDSVHAKQGDVDFDKQDEDSSISGYDDVVGDRVDTIVDPVETPEADITKDTEYLDSVTDNKEQSKKDVSFDIDAELHRLDEKIKKLSQKRTTDKETN